MNCSVVFDLYRRNSAAIRSEQWWWLICSQHHDYINDNHMKQESTLTRSSFLHSSHVSVTCRWVAPSKHPDSRWIRFTEVYSRRTDLWSFKISSVIQIAKKFQKKTKRSYLPLHPSPKTYMIYLHISWLSCFSSCETPFPQREGLVLDKEAQTWSRVGIDKKKKKE